MLIVTEIKYDFINKAFQKRKKKLKTNHMYPIKVCCLSLLFFWVTFIIQWDFLIMIFTTRVLRYYDRVCF